VEVINKLDTELNKKSILKKLVLNLFLLTLVKIEFQIMMIVRLLLQEKDLVIHINQNIQLAKYLVIAKCANKKF
jgi:hypothetical protein